TLHTNNAATCLPRLLDMGIEPFLIASTVRAIVGQRLVRRLCVDCRESYHPDEPTMKQINGIFHTDDSATMQRIHELEIVASKSGIGVMLNKDKIESTADISTTPNAVTTLWRAHKDGCDSCGHSGYRGRIGVYEVLVNSPEIQRAIVSSTTSEDIQILAIKQGMVPMQLDGFVKALRGQTTIEEILRVTSEK
ncbi:MAG: type pilus assembly protein PilB, partial [Patescibacteria group bacterium]|nr:type pilus assembly protein PilB [Patescibacteria group bacterium]